MKHTKGSGNTQAKTSRGAYVLPRKAETAQVDPSKDNPHTEASGESARGLAQRERLWLFGVLLAWLFVFTAGVVVDTSPFRNKLTDGSWTSVLEAAGAWVVVLLAYTVSNIAILCMLSSVLGVMGSHARLGFEKHHNVDETNNPYSSGLIRGFVVFLVILAGLLVIDGTPFSSPSQDQYLRLAGFVSLFSFLVSYNPHAFATVMKRVQITVQPDADGKAPGEEFEGQRPSPVTESPSPIKTE